MFSTSPASSPPSTTRPQLILPIAHPGEGPYRLGSNHYHHHPAGRRPRRPAAAARGSPRFPPALDSTPYAHLPQSRLSLAWCGPRAQTRHRRLLERQGHPRESAQDGCRAARPALAAAAGRGDRPHPVERLLLLRPRAGHLRAGGRRAQALWLERRARRPGHLLRDGAGGQSGGRDVTAMEMTKWFDTNYHYIVPEFEPGQAFRLSSSKPVDEFLEAKALGIQTKPVLLGPVTFLLLGKTRTARFDRLTLLDALLPVYAEALSRLVAAGSTWTQLDEPSLALDRSVAERAAYVRAYRYLAERVPKAKLLVATYFAALDDNLATALELPVAGLHVDAVRSGERLASLLAAWPVGGGRDGKVLSLGVIDGRNIWKADLSTTLRRLEDALERAGAAQLWVAPSCSLLHVPIDLELERRLDTELKGWLAFAKQKLAEVATLARALRDGRDSVAGALEAKARDLAAHP